MRVKGRKTKEKSFRWKDMKQEIALGWAITYAARFKNIQDKLYRKMKK